MPGNHEYESAGAFPYFEYFGEMASGPTGEGYYSFEVGEWHAVALNSNIRGGVGSSQAAWLRKDLAASRARCTIAYWHHPLFTSGPNGDTQSMREIWRILYEAGADIVDQRARAHVRAIRAAGSRWPYRSSARDSSVHRRNWWSVSLSAEDPAPEQREPDQLVRCAEADAVVRSISVGVHSNRRRARTAAPAYVTDRLGNREADGLRRGARAAPVVRVHTREMSPRGRSSIQ